MVIMKTAFARCHYILWIHRFVHECFCKTATLLCRRLTYSFGQWLSELRRRPTPLLRLDIRMFMQFHGSVVNDACRGHYIFQNVKLDLSAMRRWP